MSEQVYANWRQKARHEPAEAHELWIARYDLLVEQFMASQITHTVFSAGLYALGFRSSDLAAELRHREQVKYDLLGRWD